MADTEILLTIDLDTTDAYKQANQLQKEVENIFKSRKGAQSSTLTSIELQMKKIYDQSNKIKSSMKEMLDVHVDYSNVVNEFAELNAKADEVFSKLREVKNDPERAEQLATELEDIYNQLDSLVPMMEKLEKLQMPTEEFAKLQEEYTQINSQMEKGEGNYIELEKKLDSITNKMNDMRIAGTSVISPEGLDEFKANESKLDGYNDKLKQLVIRYNEVKTRLEEKLNPPTEDLEEFEGELENVGDTGKKTSSRLSGVLNLLKTAIDKVRTGMKALLGHFKSMRRTTSSASNPFKSILRSIIRIGLGVSTLFVLWNKLRSGVREGFSNLTKDNKAFKKTVDSLKGSLTTFKNSLAAAFQPIVSVAIPYIQKLVDWMTSLMQQVAKFSATIVGQKYYMKVIKQTGDAAEKAQKQLSGFDKLNVLNSENGAGGTMFEEVPLDNAEELLEEIKDLFSLNGLYNLGKTFAEKINEFLENIPWDTIKQKAAEIGQKIATFLNGWIDNLHWDEIGHTVAEGFNTLFNFLYNFVNTLHWKEIGEGIGKALTAFFTDTDFKLIANTIAGYINGLGETIAGFLRETDFKLIGEKIGGFLDELITGGEDGIGGIDFKLIGENLYHAIIGLADIVINTMTSVDWEEVGNKIADCLKEIFDPNKDPNVFETVAKVLWECLKAAVSLNKGIWEDNPVAGLIIDGIIAAITVSSVTPIITSLASMFGLAATTGTGAAAIAAACNPIGLAIAAAIAVGIVGYNLGEKLGDLIFSEDNPLVPKDVDKFMNIGKQATDALVEGMQQKTDLLNAILDSQSTEESRAALEKYIEGVFNGVSRSTLYSIGEKVDWEAVFNVPGMKLVGDNLVYAGNKIITKAEQARTKLELLGVSANNLGNAFAYEGPKIITFADALRDFVTKNASGRLIDLFGGVTNAMTMMGSTMLNEEEIIATSMDGVINSTSTMGSSVQGTLQQIATNTNFTSQAFSTAARDMASTSSSIKSIFSSLNSALRSAFNGIIGGSEKMGNSVTDGVNQATDSLNNFRFTLPWWVPGIGGQTLSFSIPRLNRRISIPRLAEGAVIPPNKEFLAVLGDQKQGTNIEAPLDTIKQAFTEVVMQMNTPTQDTGDIVINIDGDEVFRVVRDKDRIFKKSTGKSAFA